MSHIHTAFGRTFLGLMLLLALSCRTWTSHPTTQAEIDLLAGNGQRLRIASRDDSTIILTDARVVRDSIVGLSLGEPQRRIAVAISDVKSVQRLELAYPGWEKTLGHSYLVALGALSIAFFVAAFRL